MKRNDFASNLSELRRSADHREQQAAGATCESGIEFEPMEKTFRHIRVSLPTGYTEEHADRIKAVFPGIYTVLNCRSFGIEEEVEGDVPSQELKAVFVWIEKNL
jgi:hypothetical protein